MTDASAEDLERSTRSLLDAIRSIEWSRIDGGPNPARLCPSCNWPKAKGHDPRCKVARAIAEAAAVLPEPEPPEVEVETVTSVLPRWARLPVKLAIWLLWTFELSIALSDTVLPYGLDTVSLILSCIAISSYWSLVGRGPQSDEAPSFPQKGIGTKG